MRMSKTLATSIAEQLTAKMGEEIRTLKDKKDKICIGQYQDSIPKVVIDCAKEHPKYFSFHRSGSVICDGNYNGYVDLNELPSDGANIVLGKANSHKVSKILMKIDKLKEERRVLISEIESTLIALGTYAKIRESFPEAHALIPERGGQLVVNTDAVRSKLAKI